MGLKLERKGAEQVGRSRREWGAVGSGGERQAGVVAGSDLGPRRGRKKRGGRASENQKGKDKYDAQGPDADAKADDCCYFLASCFLALSLVYMLLL